MDTREVTGRYARVVNLVVGTPWAILPEKLAAILDVLRYHVSGGRLTAEELQEWIAVAPARAASRSGAIAVLPLVGTIAQRMDMMTASSGGTSTEQFGARFQEAVRDPGVGAVLIEVDSPGGTVTGVDELSDEIYRARGSKPIVAVANSMAASAAYWIASAADELVVTPGGEVGSIGVIAAHEDMSAYLDRDGRRVTLVSAGKYKAEGNPYEPLNDEARDAIQKRVNEYYAMFTARVSRNRGTPIATVRDSYGEGRVVGAREALELGMVDRIATLGETIDRLARDMRANREGARAELDYRARRLRARAR